MQHEVTPFTFRRRRAGLEPWCHSDDRIGRGSIDAAPYPQGHVHVQGASALLFVSVPRPLDVAERGFSVQEAAVEFVPAVIILTRGFDRTCARVLPIACSTEISPAHLVGGERDEELGRAVPRRSLAYL